MVLFVNLPPTAPISSMTGPGMGRVSVVAGRTSQNGAHPRVVRQRVWVRRDEVVDALEVYEGARRTFYSYTYRVDRDGTWIPTVRWDNWEGQDHVDRYDETGAPRDRLPWRERPLAEVLKLVKMFRRNLLTMNLQEL